MKQQSLVAEMHDRMLSREQRDDDHADTETLADYSLSRFSMLPEIRLQFKYQIGQKKCAFPPVL